MDGTGDIILSEVKKTVKGKHHMIPNIHAESKKKNTNELICRTETDFENKLEGLPKGQGFGEGRTRGLGLAYAH